MKRKRVWGRLRAASLAAICTIAFGAVGVASAGPASADPVSSPELTYKCEFPLIGSQPITFIAHSDLPDFKTSTNYKLDITAEATVPLASADGLWAARAQTISGTAKARATLYTPDKPGGVDVTTTVNLPTTPITGEPSPPDNDGVALPAPRPTSGFKINNIKGTSPEANSGPKAGWGQINVENLELTIKPLDSKGALTSLGEFKADCWLLPANPSNVLGQAWISDGSTPQTPKPAPLTTQPVQSRDTVAGGPFPANPKESPPIKFVCAIGTGIGTPTIPVTMKIDYPAEVSTYTRMPVIRIPISAHIDANTTNGIGGLGGFFISGTAYSNNVIRTPEYPNGVRAQTIAKLNKTAVPQSPDGGITLPDPFDLTGEATAPQLAFKAPGTGSVTIGDTPPTNVTDKPDMVLDVTGYAKDGTTVVKRMKRNCALPADQQGKQLTSWKVNATSSAAPSVPQSPTADVKADKRVEFKWTGSTNTTPSGVSGYNVFVDGKKIGSSGKPSFSTLPGAIADGEHELTVSAFDTSDPPKESAQSSPPVKFTVGTVADKPPSDPKNVKAEGSSDGTGKYTVTWEAATAGSKPIAGYNVYLDEGAEPVGSTNASTFTFSKTGLGNGAHSVKVSAFDAGGLEGAKSAAAPFTISSPTTLPGKPGEVKGTGSSDGSGKYSVSWKAAVAGSNPIAGYRVYLDEGQTPAGMAGADATSFAGTTSFGEHTVRVSAVDTKGGEGPKSDASAPFTISKPSGALNFILKGTTRINAANGTVPLTGTVNNVTVDSGGKLTADLALARTSGKFELLGFIPATADVAFSQLGQTTGTVSGTTLNTKSKMTVKLPSIKVFGFQVGGGESCQTATPAEVPLKSANYTPAGGTLTGSYTLPGLQGCGPFTQLLSAFMAGPDNTISVTLTQKP